MNASSLRNTSLVLALAGALGACGGGERADAAGRSGTDEAPQVYTSEVESVSEWIREGGAGDSLELVAAKNPRGEGVVVYARGKDGAANTQTAAWMVVDSQVVPLNRASRRITPKLPTGTDERTWSRIGITRPAEQGDADLRDVIPPPQPAQRAQPRETGREPTPQTQPRSETQPREAADSAPQVPRTINVRDTVRIPAGPAQRDTPAASPPAASQPKPAQRPRQPRDTLVVRSGPPTDTSQGPRSEPATSGTPPARPEAEPAPVLAPRPPALRR